MSKLICLILIVVFSNRTVSGDTLTNSGTLPADTIRVTADHRHRSDTSVLNGVIVTGYGNSRNPAEIPASIAQIKPADLERYSNTSVLPALNLIPGVVMEERSPGSYRISIRGSSIRSPYGIRNVKVYLDGIPLTDAGGNTNLNLLDFHTIGNIEIIKGPTGSMYGAGAGGTILITSKFSTDSLLHATAGFTTGSYGLRNLNFEVNNSGPRAQTSLGYSELRSTGYRVHTAMQRKEVNFSTRRFLSDRETISLTAFYTDLGYETPGALTYAEYNFNPRQARPATAAAPSAVQQKAAIYRKEIFSGLSHQYTWNEHWSNSTSANLTGDQFTNPFLTNYERELEFGYGLRTVTRLNSKLLAIPFHLQFGAEYQYLNASDRNYRNKNGLPDSLTSDNELRNSQFTAFTQLEAELPLKLILNAGLSYNQVSYHIFNLTDKPAMQLGSRYKPVAVPRIALLKQVMPFLSAYLSLSAGYSPPANSEALESTGFFNTALKAENSLTLEAGLKGSLQNRMLGYEVTLFDNRTRNTIVQRQNAAGQLSFINQGSTVEKGLEFLWHIQLTHQYSHFLTLARLVNSVTINNFYFQHETIGAANVSGHALTGTAPYASTTGIDLGFYHALLLNLTARYSDRIPLNDAGTVRSAYYIVTDGRLSFKSPATRRTRFELSAGIGNAFNQKYSLGNDLNGFGRRYYNVAAGRNFYAGVTLSY